MRDADIVSHYDGSHQGVAQAALDVTAERVKRKRRHWGPTCGNCRARKVRCPRGQPICSACARSEKLSETCIYDKMPSAAYLKSLSSSSPSRSAETSADVGLVSPSKTHWHSPIRSEGVDSSAQTLYSHIADETTIRTFDPPITSIPSIVPSPIGTTLHDDDAPLPFHGNGSREIIDRSVNNLHVYGQLPVLLLRRLLYYAFTWIQPSYQIFSISSLLQRSSNATSLETVPPIAWVALTHADRFLGPLGTRTSEGQQHSQHLRQLCQQSLLRCMYAPPSLSAVEAFMQQAASNVGAGEASQAWINSGIAFRLASDVGLFRPEQPTPDASDLAASRNFTEIRRLFWSLYSFDKALAVYLGRMPFLTSVPHHFRLMTPSDAAGANNDPDMVDLSDPNQTIIDGKPLWWERKDADKTVKLHRVAFFYQQCEIMQKVQRAMELLYYPTDEVGKLHGRLNDPRWLLNDMQGESSKARLQKVEELCTELRDWWSLVPASLKIKPYRVESQQQAYPCNVVNLNIWYHTLTILIRRVDLIQHAAKQRDSMTPSPADHICMMAAGAIEAILRIALRTTGYHRFGFGLAYGVYTAATAVTYPLVRLASTSSLSSMDITESEPAILLAFFVDTLSKMRAAMPGVNRSYTKLCKYVFQILGKQMAQNIFTFQDFNDDMDQQADLRSFSPADSEAVDMLFNLSRQVDISPDRQQVLTSELPYIELGTQSVNLDDLFSLPIFPGPMPDFQLDFDQAPQLEHMMYSDLFS